MTGAVDGSGHVALAWQHKLAWPGKNRNIYILSQIKEKPQGKRENMELDSLDHNVERQWRGKGKTRYRVVETLVRTFSPLLGAGGRTAGLSSHALLVCVSPEVPNLPFLSLSIFQSQFFSISTAQHSSQDSLS